MTLLDIGGGEHVEAVAAPRIGFAGGVLDALEVGVEGFQKTILVAGMGIDAAKRVGFHKEGDLPRVIVAPESHPMVVGIVAPTLVRKVYGHVESVNLFSGKVFRLRHLKL